MMLHREASAFTEDGLDRDDEVIEYRHNASETLLEVLARLRGRSSKDLGARARSLPAAEPKPAAAPAPRAVPPPRPPTPPPPPREESARLSRRVPQDFGAMFDVWVPDEALPAVRAEATRVLLRRRCCRALVACPSSCRAVVGRRPRSAWTATVRHHCRAVRGDSRRRVPEALIDSRRRALQRDANGATASHPAPSIGRCTRSFDSGPTRRLSRTRWGTPTRVQCKPQCIRPLAEPM
jgi:hypothetical protein